MYASKDAELELVKDIARQQDARLLQLQAKIQQQEVKIRQQE